MYCCSATLLATGRPAIAVLDCFHSHLTLMLANLIWAYTAAGQFGMEQFQGIGIHAITQYGDAVEQFQVGHGPGVRNPLFCSYRCCHGSALFKRYSYLTD
jgi:hypothetical protein